MTLPRFLFQVLGICRECKGLLDLGPSFSQRLRIQEGSRVHWKIHDVGNANNWTTKNYLPLLHGQ